MDHLSTDVLVVGAGAAGMYASVSAAKSGAEVILCDKSLISRGGATVMAQMTVAAAIDHQEAERGAGEGGAYEAGAGGCRGQSHR